MRVSSPLVLGSCVQRVLIVICASSRWSMPCPVCVGYGAAYDALCVEEDDEGLDFAEVEDIKLSGRIRFFFAFLSESRLSDGRLVDV